MILTLVMQMLQRFLGFSENFFAPFEQLYAEILALALIHKWFFVARPITTLQYGRAFTVLR
jgi:hypothetical protein